jgi:hypothetical protein
MDLLKAEDVVTVTIFEIRLSEAELQMFSDAFSYLLKTLDDKKLNEVFTMEEEGTLMENLSETRLFVEDRYKEMMAMIKNNCREEFLPKRFRDWKEPSDES